MRFIILEAAMIAAASAIVAQIDPLTGQIVDPMDWLNGILVSKRLMYMPFQLPIINGEPLVIGDAPDPVDPIDWLNGVLVSKRIWDPPITIAPIVQPLLPLLTGVLVSKRIVAGGDPLSILGQLDPLDLISGVLVSRRIIAQPIDPTDPLSWLTGILVSKRIVAQIDPNDWLSGILVSKRQDFLDLVSQAQGIIDYFTSTFKLQDKRDVINALNVVLQTLTERRSFEDAVDSLTNVLKRGAFEDAVDNLTSLTKKDVIESLVRKRAVNGDFGIGDVSVISK